MTSGYGGFFLSFLVRITTRDLRGDEIIASVGSAEWRKDDELSAKRRK